ncbi:carboxypeptidase-like regulatory domain-containing protein [Aquimarina brevivitae]|uniref:Carboxypeptidase-like protein n=1 Tax=Aquimarina brevivitae TaxID=323412 RepID=A0A4Q7PFZ2_9FLAO|nr:carboxypeptidase-like regulatory domain-containing protein [Aquimarina brevivitae]RZS99423.1 carboxypeptidase-like protein [Aquimarina brevivitae]
MRFFAILVFIFFCSLSSAQSIKGVIISKDSKQPVEGANVYTVEPKKGTVSDFRGKFSLVLDKLHGNDTIYLSHIGYHQKKISLSAFDGKKITIELTPKVEELDNVSVIKEKKLSPKIVFERLPNIGATIYAFGSAVINDKIYISGGDYSVENDQFLKTFELNAGFMNLEPTFQQILQRSRYVASNIKGYKDDLRAFDIKQKKWINIPIDLRKRAYHTLLGYQNKLFIIGGKRLAANERYEYLESKIEIVDLTDNSIAIDDTNPHQAVNPGAILYKDRIILLGGSTKIKSNGYKTYSDKIHSLNLTTGLWYEIGKMPFKGEMKVERIKNVLYIIEKASRTNNYKSYLHLFDLQTGKWSSKGELPDELINPAIASSDTHIYFLGNGNLYMYNIKNSIFREYVIDLFIEGATMHYFKDSLYVLGGYNEDAISKEPTAEMFRIKLDQLSKTKIKLFVEL